MQIFSKPVVDGLLGAIQDTERARILGLWCLSCQVRQSTKVCQL